MAIKSKKVPVSRLIVAIVGGATYFLFNILFPYLKFMFPFLEVSEDFAGDGKWTAKWYASLLEFTFSNSGISTYSINFTGLEGSEVEFLWTLLDFWQWFFLLGGIIALILVIISEVIVTSGSELPSQRISLSSLGFIVGLVASGVEWLLYILIWLMEDWGDKLISGLQTQPDLGFILLLLNTIGVIALYIASKPSLVIRG